LNLEPCQKIGGLVMLGRFVAVFAVLVASLTIAAQTHENPTSPATATGEHMEATVFPLAETQWKEGPAALPKGAKIAVLEGDPNKEGPFLFRLKLPDGYRVPPHTHPKTERVTVIAGTFNLGMGEKFDADATRPRAVGT
jgi:anti-sigma factor ChrR (cupin superfamily)